MALGMKGIYRTGFSLVELSIVLVILGLLVGGVLSGQALIRAAQMRSIPTEFGRYSAAVQSFRDKYFALPGDFNNATAFWGKDNVACAGNTGAVGSPGTCNGDGDGTIASAAVATGVTSERFQFWKQLALAGLIEGNYTGVATALGPGDIIGTTSPKSKMNAAGWSAITRTNYGGDGAFYKFDYGNMFSAGSQDVTDVTRGAILLPSEAWNIDTKMDDGLPTSGRVLGTWYNGVGCTSKADGTASTVSDVSDIYILSGTTIGCALAFAKAF